MTRTVSHDELDLLVSGGHGDPHAVLGAHPHEGGVTVRVLRPLASSVEIRHGDDVTPLEHEYGGVWVGELPGTDVPDYRVTVTYDGGPWTYDDPYRYLPTLGEVDLHLINEGRHEKLWTVLGAHVRTFESGVTGTSFAVWAPSARGVADHRRLQRLGRPRAPDAPDGHLRGLGAVRPRRRRGHPLQVHAARRRRRLAREGRPAGLRHRGRRPATSSVVSESSYTWGDEEWLAAARGDRRARTPRCRSTRCTSARGGAGSTTRRSPTSWSGTSSHLGFTHVEFLPVMEHPFGGSWGYQVTSYFAPTARFGDPDGLRYLIDRLHQAGIGVILDWVPAHFPKDDFALARFDGTPLYEHPDPSRGEHPDWGTLRLQLRPPRGPQLPGRQRALLARGVPRRRDPGGRGRLDDLPRLLPRAGPVEPQRARRPREPRGGPVRPGDDLGDPAAGARRLRDRRGVHRLAGGHQAHHRGRARVRLQVEHGLDARLARLHRRTTRSTGATTTSR